MPKPSKPVLAGIAIACAVFWSLNAFAVSRIVPGTTVAGVPFGGLPVSRVGERIKTLSRKTVTMKIQNRMYPITLDSMGVIIDETALMRELTAPNRNPFPPPVVSAVMGILHPREITPRLVFTEQFQQFVRSVPGSFHSQEPEDVRVDGDSKQLVLGDRDERFEFDERDLSMKITQAIASGRLVIKPKLVPSDYGDIKSIEEDNERIARAYETPATVHVIDADGQPERDITIPSDTLRTLLTVQYHDGRTAISVDRTLAERELERLMSRETAGDIAIDRMADDLEALMNDRFTGHSVDTVLAYRGFVPNTHGELERKYIEVDISQQRMFLFSGGKLAKTYVISTGKDWPTPTGRFEIFNKAANAFSKIYNVWMPYWMGFYVDPKLHASLGIHELPYWIDPAGQKIQRPRDFIGSPNTGGCIALDVGKAKEVFQFADVGTAIYIYE